MSLMLLKGANINDLFAFIWKACKGTYWMLLGDESQTCAHSLNAEHSTKGQTGKE